MTTTERKQYYLEGGEQTRGEKTIGLWQEGTISVPVWRMYSTKGTGPLSTPYVFAIAPKTTTTTTTRAGCPKNKGYVINISDCPLITYAGIYVLLLLLLLHIRDDKFSKMIMQNVKSTPLVSLDVVMNEVQIKILGLEISKGFVMQCSKQHLLLLLSTVCC